MSLDLADAGNQSAVMIKPGEEIIAGGNRRFLVIVGLLQVEAA
jgi:hypothetical protein